MDIKMALVQRDMFKFFIPRNAYPRTNFFSYFDKDSNLNNFFLLGEDTSWVTSSWLLLSNISDLAAGDVDPSVLQATFINSKRGSQGYMHRMSFTERSTISEGGIQ